MKSILDQLLGSPTLITLSLALLISSSISIFDVRINQARKSGALPPDHPYLPKWVAIFHMLDWGLKIALLIISWKVGLLIIVTLFVLKVLPVLETIGNILMAPFKPKPSLKGIDACTDIHSTRSWLSDADADADEDEIRRLLAMESINPNEPLTQELVSNLVLANQRLGVGDYDEIMSATLRDLRTVFPELTRRQMGSIFLGDDNSN